MQHRLGGLEVRHLMHIKKRSNIDIARGYICHKLMHLPMKDASRLMYKLLVLPPLLQLSTRAIFTFRLEADPGIRGQFKHAGSNLTYVPIWIFDECVCRGQLVNYDQISLMAKPASIVLTLGPHSVEFMRHRCSSFDHPAHSEVR